MQRLSFRLFLLVAVLVAGFSFSGIFQQVVQSSESEYKNKVMEEEIYHNQPSQNEKKQQQKELEIFLEKKVKPNELLPLPNPKDELKMKGMPLPDSERVEANNI
ncbi:hypothetical protein [Halalkalibacter urbisdiaboli]|uniref:hypothetical protein n=1 Tax=Halalkalibacter urbisdiaboli TaxID=1960589 RepID=UPI000B433A83|nr:hypothetical protein [Halalkalibacter urbisdiaboli]